MLQMAESDFLSASRLAILGLGLMGGSLAMALRGRCASIFGIDPDPRVLSLASERKIADRVSQDPADLLPEADLIVLAAPVRTIVRLLGDLPNWHPGPAVVIDLGSTKVEITAAMAGLPEWFDPIGGHPMCGKERSSLAYADERLFVGAPFALTALARTTSRARSAALQIVQACGAVPVWLDAVTHDAWTAATSHLPYLAASALASITPTETSALVGPGFRSTARLAAASPGMMLDILITNRANVLAGLAEYRRELVRIENLLAEGDEESLTTLLGQAAARYDFLSGRGA